MGIWCHLSSEFITFNSLLLGFVDDKIFQVSLSPLLTPLLPVWIHNDGMCAEATAPPSYYPPIVNLLTHTRPESGAGCRQPHYQPAGHLCPLYCTLLQRSSHPNYNNTVVWFPVVNSENTAVGQRHRSCAVYSSLIQVYVHSNKVF